MKALLGVALALAAVAGGRFLASSLDHAIDAPQAQFDKAADARIAQLREQEREIARLVAIINGH
jgi:hypothetical protein